MDKINQHILNEKSCPEHVPTRKTRDIPISLCSFWSIEWKNKDCLRQLITYGSISSLNGQAKWSNGQTVYRSRGI